MNAPPPHPGLSESISLGLLILQPLTVFLFVPGPLAAALPERGPMAQQSLGPRAQWQIGGVVGERLAANLDQWLLCAPAANPGMLEMFRVRDRQPAPQLVPWAGEFAGKYLISGVQALVLTNSPALRHHLANFVAGLLATQADDGYLGPFPKAERLRGNWDLWGHYHVMEGLLLWHEFTGDEAAWRAVLRAADLMCDTYLGTPRRVLDAGSPEMNMAAVHVLVRLHRLTGQPRYLALAREIEKDWEKTGDYLRAGVAGTEFFASPRPRWESLHDLQGLVEFWRVTGEARYREAFQHHWRSIARFDRHNGGGFSSGEQATGNPWNPAPIETCCTVAWQALGVDMLRLTGDPRVADELELALLNGGLGAQHPSGRWWTYNTPMDGVREASAHSIVFQARAGTPELNCCSVNGPRTLGMLGEWAVMRDPAGLTLNWHGPLDLRTTAPNGTPVRLRSETSYPLDGQVRWTVEPESGAGAFALRFRIPGWSERTGVRLNGEAVPAPRAPACLELNRAWRKNDTVEIQFDMRLHFLPGDREALGQVSLYRGPLLLAWDPRFTDFNESKLPAVDLARRSEARVVADFKPAGALQAKPWLLVDVAAAAGQTLRLCDFASAGSTGLRYRSWLPALLPPPPPAITRAPADGATIGSGQTTFRWTSRPSPLISHYRVMVCRDQDGSEAVATFDPLTQPRLVLADEAKRRLPAHQSLWWKVIAEGPNGETASQPPLARFVYDPAQPSPPERQEFVPGPGGVIVRAPLRGEARPEYGRLERPPVLAPAPGLAGEPNGAVRLNGRDQMLVYALPEDFGEAFTAAAWVRMNALPAGRIGQILSLWANGMDDPLRLTIDGGKLFARIEAQHVFTTRGTPLAVAEWHHIAAVKSGATLVLYLDGRPQESVAVPAALNTTARTCAIGGNPNYSGNEFLAADFARFELYGRALTADEIAARAKR
jgi:uncharacterized protein